MTPQQEAHLELLKREAAKLIDQKYRRGQREHGGNLWKKPGLLDMAIDEAIDLIVYLLTLKAQIADPGIVDPRARDV